MDSDLTRDLAGVVADAAARREPLSIRGSGSKVFYTGVAEGEPLEVSAHRGILEHEPTELVITARAGTPLAEIDAALAARGQMLAFEPPRFGETATLGGTIACGLSGPRRPYTGSARDFVLGARIIDGRGEVLRFGGQVMKNVAGFDVSRLMVGALGTLGMLLDVSLKVLPRPERELTLTFSMSDAEAIRRMNTWASQPLPLSGACHLDDVLYLRLSGAEQAIQAAQTKLGGEVLGQGDGFWLKLREQRLSFFATSAPLWRLSVPGAAPPIELPGKWLIDWGGAQRWLVSEAAHATIRDGAAAVGGYATSFRHGPGARSLVAALGPQVRALHEQLQHAFDPHGVFRRALPLEPAA